MQSNTTTSLNEFACGSHLLLCSFLLAAYQGCIIRLLLLDVLKEYYCRLPVEVRFARVTMVTCTSQPARVSQEVRHTVRLKRCILLLFTQKHVER